MYESCLEELGRLLSPDKIKGSGLFFASNGSACPY